MTLSANSKMLAAVIGAFLAGVAGTTLAIKSRDKDDQPASPQVSAAKPQDGDDRKDPDAKSGDADASASSQVEIAPKAAANAGIRTQSVTYSAVSSTLLVPGVVETSPNKTAIVSPPVAGNAVQILVGVGQNVHANQPVVVLQSAEVAQAQAAVQQAQADQQQAEAKVETAIAEARQARIAVDTSRETLRRQQQLASAGVFSQAPLQTAQSEQSAAQSELLQAQSDLQTRTTTLARAERLFQAGVDSRAELEQAQADQRQGQIRVDQAQNQVGITRQALTREQKVFSGGLLTQQAIQTAQADLKTAAGDEQRLHTELDAARIALSGARQTTASARTNLAALVGRGRAESNGRLTLYAPISGTVAELPVTLGESVERSSVLLTLQNLASVTVSASVGEGDVSLVRVGEPVKVAVASYPNRQFAGVVQSLGDSLDPKTRTLSARCLVENPAGLLRPQMFGRVTLVTHAGRASLLVPRSAVLLDSGQSVVYVAEGDGYEKRVVKTGEVVGAKIDILSGVNPGDHVVVKGAFILMSQANLSSLKDDD